jgi:hypothetical protein
VESGKGYAPNFEVKTQRQRLRHGHDQPPGTSANNAVGKRERRLQKERPGGAETRS